MERVKDFSKLSIDLKQNENCATMATKLATHGSGNWSVIDLKWRYTQHVNSQHVITKQLPASRSLRTETYFRLSLVFAGGKRQAKLLVDLDEI